MSKFNKYKKTIPSIFKIDSNPVWKALITAIANQDDEIITQLENTKAQLFVKTASGKYLDQLASDFGVKRPPVLGLLDDDFRELIPNQSTKAKQIRKIFYDNMRIFWGDLFQKANITSTNLEPFVVSTGETLVIKNEDGIEQTIKIAAGDLKVSGAAEASELIAIFNERLNGITAEAVQDPVTSNNYINLRTDTPGTRGSIEIVSTSTMIDPAKLDFTTDREYRISDLSQRTVIYQVRPGELTIELPAVVPVLRRSLKGSHHLHNDGTLESPVPPANGVWIGSFLYDPDNSAYSISKTRFKLQDLVEKGKVYSTLTSEVVENVADFPNEPGWLIFDFGLSGEEQPVPYLGIANDRTILLDPSYKFQNDHSASSYVNYLNSLTGTVPRTTGDDYAIYLTSPSDARSTVQELLSNLVAAGVIVNFEIILPSYKYLADSDNPYL